MSLQREYMKMGWNGGVQEEGESVGERERDSTEKDFLNYSNDTCLPEYMHVYCPVIFHGRCRLILHFTLFFKQTLAYIL